MGNIHPTAIVAEGAQLADDVEVGAFSIIGDQVVIGQGGKIHSHVVLDGKTIIGKNVEIFPFAAIGMVPQDLKFEGEDVRTEIGDNVTLREYVTINPGTKGGGSVTRIGNHCLLMVGTHVAHDCILGDHVIMVNHSGLAGHVEVGNFAIIAGMSAVIQFARIGEHAFVGAMTGIENDLIPFGSALGNRAHLGGLNVVGLKRRGFSRDQIHNLRHAYKLLFAEEGTLADRVEQVASEYSEDANVMKIVDFIRADTKKALLTPRTHRE